jgi:hypothetical protein
LKKQGELKKSSSTKNPPLKTRHAKIKSWKAQQPNQDKSARHRGNAPGLQDYNAWIFNQKTTLKLGPKQ